MKHEEKISLLKIMWDYGVYSLQELFDMAKKEKITKEEFHNITGYNYEGIKKSREWD